SLVLITALLAVSCGGGGEKRTPSHTWVGAGGGGPCDVPVDAPRADVSTPTTAVGDGTPESCTSDAFVEAVEGGGVLTFDCGPDPVTITLDRTAKVVNDASEEVVIDGGALVTLSGGGAH